MAPKKARGKSQEAAGDKAAKRPQTPQEAGRKGGKLVSSKYGPDFFREIGRKGGSTTKKRYGIEFYGKIGKKGGKTTFDRHGQPFYEEIGKKGGQRVKELIERAKAQERDEQEQA